MAQKLVVPKFANESVEARWWFENRDAIEDAFDLAEREGRLGRGTAMRRALAASAPAISLDLEDVERARAQAQRRGLEYQAHVKMVVHQALLSEENRA